MARTAGAPNAGATGSSFLWRVNPRVYYLEREEQLGVVVRVFVLLCLLLGCSAERSPELQRSDAGWVEVDGGSYRVAERDAGREQVVSLARRVLDAAVVEVVTVPVDAGGAVQDDASQEPVVCESTTVNGRVCAGTCMGSCSGDCSRVEYSDAGVGECVGSCDGRCLGDCVVCR